MPDTNGHAPTDPASDVQSILRALNENHATGREPSGFIKEMMQARERMQNDPAFTVPGMPPEWGNSVLPHVLTFQGLFGTFSRVYRASDEALKDSLEQARFMRNDPAVMECVESRQRSTALLDWHLEPEDPESEDQKDLCKQLEKILHHIRRFTEYRNVLLQAIWFGRNAIQHQFNWKKIGGKMRLLPYSTRGQENIGWVPVHGDKLVFRYDDGTTDHIPWQLGIRVGARFGTIDRILPERWSRRIEPTDRGPAFFLTDYERQLFAVHKHMIEDGAYEDGLDAGMIHGVGIRSRIYWAWFQKQQALAFLMEYLTRSAGGLEVWYYPMGNKDALAKVQAAAQNRIAGGRNITFVPKPLGEDGAAYGVEFVEPGLAGIDMMREIITTLFGHQIKRYILGQVLSSEAEATGLGSGVADLHLDTLLQIIKYDAVNLEETLTFDLLKKIKDWNFPSARDIDIRFKIDTESPDVEQKLQSMAMAFEMGKKLSAKQIGEMVGAVEPTDDEDILQNPEAAQREQMRKAPGEGNGEFNPGFPDKEEHANQIMHNLKMGGMGSNLPPAPKARHPRPGVRGDHGDRHRASRRDRQLRQYGYRRFSLPGTK